MAGSQPEGAFMKKILVIVTAIAAVVLLTVQVRAVTAAKSETRTAVGAVAPARIVAEGRVTTYPGFEVTIASDLGGTISALHVQEKDRVEMGEVVATIRADETRAALEEARAAVTEADADIRLYQLEVERAKSLFAEAVGTKQTWERAVRDLDAARARRSRARAEVAKLAATLEKSKIVSPIRGSVTGRDVHEGETVEPGAPILSVADLTKTRIEAEIDEYDAARVKLGAAVLLRAEGYDSSWRGRIEEIPDAVVSRRLKPQDPGKPIDTRVLLVKIAFAEPTPLKLGQRVEIEIAQ